MFNYTAPTPRLKQKFLINAVNTSSKLNAGNYSNKTLLLREGVTQQMSKKEEIKRVSPLGSSIMEIKAIRVDLCHKNVPT